MNECVGVAGGCRNTHTHTQTHPVCVLAALSASSTDQPLPEFGRDAGDVAGAGDGGGVQRSQVRRGHRRPAGGQEVDDHQLLLQENHQRRRVIKVWEEEEETKRQRASEVWTRSDGAPLCGSTLWTVKKSMTRDVKSRVTCSLSCWMVRQ